MDNVVQIAALATEFAGLTLIAVEIYMPDIAEKIRAALDRLPRGGRQAGEVSSVWLWILGWVVATAVASAIDARLALTLNLVLAALALVLGVLGATLKLLFEGARLGVALGRGNSVGGLGLLLALIGFSMELLEALR